MFFTGQVVQVSWGEMRGTMISSMETLWLC